MLVIAYVLKDRIKDILKDHFRGHKTKGICKEKLDVFITDLNEKDLKIATINETISVGKSCQSLPESFKQSQRLQTMPIQPEKVICHRKKITLFGKRIKSLSQPLRTITDIFELDLSFLTKQLNASSKEILSFDSDGRLAPIQVNKRYFLDIGMTYSWYDIRKKQATTKSSLNRLVLYRDGIVAIRPLNLSQS